MTQIRLSRARTAQPHGTPPLARRAWKWSFLWSGASPGKDIWDKAAWTAGASTSRVVGQPGRGVRFPGSTTDGYQRTGAPTAAQTKVTFFAVFNWAGSGGGNFAQLLGTSSTNSGFRIGDLGGASGQIALVKGGVFSLGSLNLVANTTYALVASHRQDTGEFYLLCRPIRGGPTLRSSASDTSASTGGDGNFGVGISRTDFSGSWYGDIFAAGCAFDFLPERVAEQWVKLPWSLFGQDARALTIDAAAGGAPTVAISSFSADGADLVIGYTYSSSGTGKLLTASLSRDGTPIADQTTSTISGTFRITNPGAGVYTLTLLDLTDSNGTDTDGPYGSTVTILGVTSSPTLSAATVTSITSSGATPRVTITF